MTLDNFLGLLIVVALMKSYFIGSDFSFYKWFKHGTIYLHYYNHHRKSFDEWYEEYGKNLDVVE